MGLIIAEITVVLLLIAFIVFLARDDRRNRELREVEDRLELQRQASSQGAKPDH